MKRELLIEIISSLLIFLFVYAAISKLTDYHRFKLQIGQSPLLTGMGGWLPLVVLVGEFSIAAALCIARIRLLAFFAAFSLMLMFTVYIAAILYFSSYVPCSCGGVLENLGWKPHLVFNLTFVGLSFAGILLQAARENALVQQVNMR